MSIRQWEAMMLPGIWKDSVNVELEKYGRDGWELVAVLPGKEDRRELYFKRPLISNAKNGRNNAKAPSSSLPKISKMRSVKDLKMRINPV